jgi:CubicO group peptidase (beta-lactamase class C family)
MRWRRVLRRLLVVLAAVAGLGLLGWRAVRIDFATRSAGAVALRLPKEQREREVVERANELLDRYVAASHFSGEVLIGFGDKIRLERSFGIANSDTHLTFGSLAKQFTGYLIHRLAGRGLVRMDQTAGELVPELRDSPVGAATVNQLLHMTSGLPDSLDLPTNVGLQFRSTWMPEDELLRKIGSYRLAFPPGSGFLYSNVGYRLLAVVATRVTHQDWPALLRKNVFEPVGMNGAGVFEPQAQPPSDLPPGHLPYRCWLLGGQPCMLRLPRWNYSAIWGAGAVYARGRDWLAWSRFLKRLAREEPDLFARYTAPDREDYASGIGNVEIVTADGEHVRVYSHGGEDPGYTGYFAWIPSIDATLVWLSNTDYGFTSNYELGRELRALLGGTSYSVVAP